MPNHISHHEPVLTAANALYTGDGVITLPEVLECVEWVHMDTAQWIRAEVRYAEGERILRTVVAMNISRKEPAIGSLCVEGALDDPHSLRLPSCNIDQCDFQGAKMSNRGIFMARIANKLAILVGGAIAVTGTQIPAFATTSMPAGANNLTIRASGGVKLLAAKLILKQQQGGFKMLASHASHSSHSSHHSHSSHSSHSSRAI